MLALSPLLAQPLVAQHKLGGDAPTPPKIVGASDEGERAMKRFQIPEGFKLELWAAEPDVAQGVALYPDHQGRIFVAETFRLHKGVPDIRGIMDWLDEDLACRTPEDRLAEMKRHLGAKFADYEKYSDRVRLLWDDNGSGKATKSTVYADGFSGALDGIASGVISRGRDVWFANIPNLWLLRDTNNDGVADTRQVLHRGFGVRVGFLGHDMHGFIFGPDGKLYFSIGDRGSNVRVGDRAIGHPDTGSVFRCNPDGSDFEEFAYGLRNPQELAFDDFGNLFTGDNNSDGGDQARWVYLVEGGDSGWRVGWQFLEQPNARGAWNSEKMWHPQNEAQPAYIVPPIKNVTSGPSGLAYYPGTGFPDSWKGTFTLADFRGSSGNSGILSFKNKPKGASFELVEDKKFVWSMLTTDGDYGPDGAFYLMDWVEGWDQNGKGRIYKLTHTASSTQPIVAETKALLAAGVAGKPSAELVRLLAHADKRVRQEAQFELASRGPAELPNLVATAKSNPNLFARVHALWAIGQSVHQTQNTRATATGKTPSIEALDAVVGLLRDSEIEVRANAARVLGNARYSNAYDALIQALGDTSLRVRHLAATALGNLKRPESVPALFTLLQNNADTDPVVRHAAANALAEIGDVAQLAEASRHPSESVRLGAVVALRRLVQSEASLFLNDASERVATEAARAINDEPISGAMPELAALIEKPITNEPLLRRVLNANYRFGTRESAAALAQFAAKASAPENARAEAVSALSAWPANSGRDRITGLWRPTTFARDSKVPREALAKVIDSILAEAPNRVLTAAAKAAGDLQIPSAAPSLAALFDNTSRNAASRVEALKALAALRATEFPAALQKASSDTSEEVRKAAVSLSVSSAATPAPAASAAAPVAAKPSEGGPLADVLAKGTQGEKQNALAALGQMKDPAADDSLARWMDQLLQGKVPAELQLDVLEAARKRESSKVKELVARHDAGLKKDDELAAFRACLLGGNAEEGKRIFVEKAEVSCIRCHKADGEGGEVGPDLTGMITRHPREYILESLLYPNKKIAQGFDNVLVVLKNGTAYAGVIKSETGEELELNSPEDGLLKLKKADITSREKGLSGMPEGFGSILTRQEIRDLVEYISTRK